ncbi:NAD(P)-binding protein [Punctularia strigosozonata HHB-11173 SS5]|uniref:NAD(P)-binding protein n=1 Tax=Punctularia strigosozonata (strain HHB-11173) TaxID=741275 RepID=UPI0004416CFF|nr:NAD(P)-binding protein [Punctularia strigosozonata HHB-11173 SS5]EIN08975.1 NAD(P)-binding protein [Punctularia strigosozonata HHB-11173 SS5]
MPSLNEVVKLNATFSPPTTPIALFVGGTSGIGQATAEAFARYTNGNIHIILCGRNRKAADRIFKGMPPAANGGAYEFVACDVSLMKNIRDIVTELLSSLPKLNYLVLSSGFLGMGGRDETEEGIDRKLALHYYARWKFIHDLMPLLVNATELGEDAKVITIKAAGQGGKIDLNDLGLKKHYSSAKAASAMPTYNDCMIEARLISKCRLSLCFTLTTVRQAFAARQPKMSFVHMHPGVVRTPLLKPSNPILKLFYPLFIALLWPVSVSQANSGEFVMYSLLRGDKGSFRRNGKGNDIGEKNLNTSEEARHALWEHTSAETNVY